MNRLWLKITVISVVVILTIFYVIIFWPTETQTQQEYPGDSEAQPTAQHTEAENLYQMALLNTPGNSPEPSYQIMVDSCRKIFTQYPNTLQAEKAKELLRQYDMTDRQISRLYSSGPAVRKSRPLRRRPPRRYDEWPVAANDEMNPSN